MPKSVKRKVSENDTEEQYVVIRGLSDKERKHTENGEHGMPTS